MLWVLASYTWLWYVWLFRRQPTTYGFRSDSSVFESQYAPSNNTIHFKVVGDMIKMSNKSNEAENYIILLMIVDMSNGHHQCADEVAGFHLLFYIFTFHISTNIHFILY